MAPEIKYCSYTGGGPCSTSHYPILPPGNNTKELVRLPCKIGPDGMPIYRTDPTQPQQPRYVRFNDAANHTAAQIGNEQVFSPQKFPSSHFPADGSQYHCSGQRAYTTPYGVALAPVSVHPVTNIQDPKHAYDVGTKPWSVHPPDSFIMKERMRKYRNGHKASGFAGFFPDTYNMLGGSVYRIVTLEQQTENRPFGIPKHMN